MKYIILKLLNLISTIKYLNNYMIKFSKLSALLLVFIVLIFIESGYSQLEARRWYFGRKAGFDFSTTPPTLLSDGPYAGQGDVEEGHASISDAAGNYLFYTNGMSIWNKDHALMANGTGLMGNWSATQCATIFPVPESTTEYYILTTPVTGSTNGVRWNRIDMTADAGLGDIKAPVASNKNQLLPSCPTYMMESVVSVPHFNGTDIWVIAHTADNPSTSPANEGGSFIVWLVTSAGISYSGTYTIGYAYPQNAGNSRGIGIMKSNTCYTRIFISYYNESSRVEGFSFSNSTGVVGNWPAPVSGPLVINQYRNTADALTAMTSYSYGLEISLNNRYLYNTISGEAGTSKVLTQYDLQAGTGTAADIINSAVRLSPATPVGERYGQLQMGPDGKIYHTVHDWNNNNGTTSYTKISVINNPNTAGTGSNFVEVAYAWPASAMNVGTSMGLPSFHKGFLAGSASIMADVSNLREICLGNSINFNAVTLGGSVQMYEWNIDKNLNSTIDYSGVSTSTINHTYGSTGIYDVELTVLDQCGYTYTTESQVEVLPVINTTGAGTCADPVSLDVTSLPTTGKSYVWYSDAAGLNPIGSGASITFPRPYSSTVYVKEVASVSIVNTLVTPAVPGATNTISNIGTTVEASLADATTTRTTTLNVTSPLILNSFRFIARGADWACDGATASYTVNIRNTSTNAIVGTYTPSGSVHLGNAANAISISGNNRKQFNVSPALSLSAGTYAVEITLLSVSTANGCPASDGPKLGLFNFSGLSSSSTTGISNAGATTSTTSYITNISVSTEASPAVYEDVITPTNMACSNISPAIVVNCPLFVTWFNFEANRIPQSSSVALNWSTSFEENSNAFFILRSIDGIHFEKIGQVNSSINSNTLTHYSFIDDNAPSGIVYYKIQEVDYNGTSTYSRVVSLNGSESISFKLLPNPGNGNFILTGYNNNHPINLTVYSSTGQLIANVSATINENINLEYLSSGVYIVKIISAETSQTLRYVKGE